MGGFTGGLRRKRAPLLETRRGGVPVSAGCCGTGARARTGWEGGGGTTDSLPLGVGRDRLVCRRAWRGSSSICSRFWSSARLRASGPRYRELRRGSMLWSSASSSAMAWRKLLTKTARDRWERRERGNALDGGKGRAGVLGSERVSSSCTRCRMRLGPSERQGGETETPGRTLSPLGV